LKRLILPVLLAAALPAADVPITPAMNAFTTATYEQLAHGDQSLILSPFNIGTALSMALAGARGSTAAEMRTVLHLPPGSGNDAALASLVADLTKAGNSGENQLLMGNGLWVQQGFPIVPEFASVLLHEYHAPAVPLDFSANAEAARERINQWTAEHTRNKIQDLFPSGSLDARTRLVLTSAIYFYGKWQSPFMTSRTAPAPFHAPGTTVQADFMNQTTHFAYAETPTAQILEMPYAGTGIAFDVLLPKASDGLPGLEKSLTPEALTGWVGSLSSQNVQVSLPKFRAESRFSLARTLAQMGMPLAFSSRADFSGITQKGGLAISDVVHKAFVDVSEAGTEAAAATGIGVRAAMARRPEPPVVFRADHPFVFLIRDTKSGTVLFIGRLMRP